LRIIEQNRAFITRRYELILQAVVVATLVLAAAVVVLRQVRHNRRLGRLQQALEELAAGRDDVVVPERRKDTIGTIAAMIERTSREVARDRRRLASLRNLASWQEAARRHAHEIRTPLTAARLELDRLDGVAMQLGADGEVVRSAVGEVRNDLKRIESFTSGVTAFARLPAPRLEDEDLGELVQEFVASFAKAFDGVELQYEPSPQRVRSRCDREMLQQLLFNLSANSARAMGGGGGRVTFAVRARSQEQGTVAIEVADTGPGIPPAVVERLFEPYVTTRKIGDGMGLGLAISRKIALDHGGDLELVEATRGAVFRVRLPGQVMA